MIVVHCSTLCLEMRWPKVALQEGNFCQRPNVTAISRSDGVTASISLSEERWTTTMVGTSECYPWPHYKKRARLS